MRRHLWWEACRKRGTIGRGGAHVNGSNGLGPAVSDEDGFVGNVQVRKRDVLVVQRKHHQVVKETVQVHPQVTQVRALVDEVKPSVTNLGKLFKHLQVEFRGSKSWRRSAVAVDHVEQTRKNIAVSDYIFCFSSRTLGDEVDQYLDDGDVPFQNQVIQVCKVHNAEILGLKWGFHVVQAKEVILENQREADYAQVLVYLR